MVLSGRQGIEVIERLREVAQVLWVFYRTDRHGWAPLLPRRQRLMLVFARWIPTPQMASPIRSHPKVGAGSAESGIPKYPA
jgi:hypothetical protein